MKKAVFSPRVAVNVLFSAAALALLVCRGQAVAEGIGKGLSTLGMTLIPALFPFLILSEWLVHTGIGQIITRPMCGLVARLTGLSRAAAPALLLGFLCGTPVGCLYAVSLWKNDAITESDRDRLILFANNPGLGFMVGAVGGVCGDRSLGAALWVLMTTAAFLLCALSRFLFEKAEEEINMPHNGVEKPSFDLPACIGVATTNMVRIAGFYLAAAGLLGGLSQWLLRLPLLVRIGAYGLIELSAGVLSSASLSPGHAFLCCAFFSGFAGLTIGLQLRSLAREAAPSLPLYLSARLVVGALCLLLSRLYLVFLHPLRAGNALSGLLSARAMPVLPLLVFSLLLLLWMITRQKRRARQK